MPRVPRNPGSGKPPHNGPTRGGKRSGTGWGGPAQGERELRPLGGLNDEYAQAVRALARDPANEEAKRPLRELYLGTLAEMAVMGDGHMVRVHAADKLGAKIDPQRMDFTSKGERTGNLMIVSGVERHED